MEKFDVLVIGSGPAGYVCAIRAAQNGLKVACIEKWLDQKKQVKLGGTCLNVGCIPSKALLDSSCRYHDAKANFSMHGIDFKSLNFNLSKMMSRKEKIVSKLTSGVAGLLQANKVTTITGTAQIMQDKVVSITTPDDTVQTYQAEHIVIATGSVPIDIPPARVNEKEIVNSTGALAFDEIPDRLGVIGAGVIGLELGSVWSRLGSKVTVFEAAADFLMMADKQLANAALKNIKKQGLDIRLNSQVKASKVKDNTVSITYLENQSEEKTEIFDRVIVAVGRRPYTDQLIHQSAGIQLDQKGFIEVNDHCMTSIPNVYAIGDVVRGPMLAHKGSEEGIMVANLISKKQTHMNYELIPSVIYTHPEIAWAGETEESLKTKNQAYKVGVFPFSASGRALASAETDGFVKIIASQETDRVLGIHVMGPSAAELVQQGVIAMEFVASAEDLALIIFAHPTVSEAVHEAALAVDNMAIHAINRKK
ncbi:MAG: dihydrolipoyl dehydrogenase [Endozoicomonadaceae bacterium]|nr:dihydrolipoyl dehydrogenase [Endozoicomonadaceae bacterium]